MKKVLAIVLVIVLLLGGWFIMTQNNLVTLNEKINQSQGEIQTQLQRRNDLIPNLVSTVKGYAKHEKDVFTAVADARSKLAGTISSGDIEEINNANKEFESALSRLLAITENYPELKASTQFTALQDELAGTENRIAYARNQYNQTVGQFNTAIQRFPASIVANMKGYSTRPYFEAEASAQQVPQINFD